jgi:hypothetical protein
MTNRVSARTWALTAIAQSGQVELTLDQSTDADPPSHMLTLTLPSIELSFEIANLQILPDLAQFMSDHHGQQKSAELALGTLNGTPLRLIKDDEHPDRFFVVAAREGLIHLTITDPIAANLVRASAELNNELE